MNVFAAIISRDLRCRLKSGGSLAAVFSLPFILFILFPLAGGGAADAVSIQWLAFLLAMLASLSYLFEEDAADGSLDALLLCPLAMEWVVAAKCIAHWLAFALPLLPIGLLLAALGGAEVSPYTALGFLFGSVGLVLVGAAGAALVVGVGGVLSVLLVLPLYVPILIFAAEASEASLVLLVAIDLVLAVPCLWVAAAALKLGR